MQNALANDGLVVDQGTKDFAIVIITVEGEHDTMVAYGVRNKTTLVDEYQTPALGKARYVMGELQKDLDYGFDRGPEAGLPPSPHKPGSVVPISGRPN